MGKVNEKGGEELNTLRKFFKETDKILLLLCFMLSATGIVAVSSATHSADSSGFFSRDARVMLIAVAIGVVLAVFISLFDYELFLKLWPVVAVVCLGLMLVLFTPLGCAPSARDDSRCWIKITSTLYFQPSEIVKIGFVITFASHCERVREDISSLKNIVFLCLHAGLIIGLVVLTGDMGSALIFAMMFVAMMFTAGVHRIYFVIGPLLVCAVLPVAWYKLFGTIQRNRILALFYPDIYPNEIYQQNLAEKAMQNGGLTGTGLFKGVYSKTVPECQNDMIFSVIGEEFGFIGTVLLMLLFVLLIIKIMRVGRKSGSYPAKIMCSGIAFMLGSQVMVNIGMCTKLLPVIGITLPFISAGGSSSLCIYIAIGLVLSISRYSREVPVSDFIYRGKY